MHIVFFHRMMKPGWESIEGSFRPIIEELKKRHKVDEYHLPYSSGYPHHLIKNILFVHKHACSDGINHISGDVHYCVLGMLNKRSVITIHDDYSVRRARFGILNKMYRWLLWIYLPIKFCSAAVCTNPLNYDRIKTLYNSSKLLSIIHIHPAKDFLPSKQVFNKVCPRILQIGTEPNKNLETTLNVLKDINCKLVVLKKMTESQKKLANDNGIEYVNRYNLPFVEVIDEYKQADIIVFPSTYEGTGMPIMEGQACGKPVITSNIEPMSWVAGDGALLLDDPMDVEEYRAALQKIINDDEFRNKLVQRGLANSKRFTCEEGTRRYEELYNKLMENKS